MDFIELYNMNTAVATFLHTAPQAWRKRRQKLVLNGDCLSVYTMSLEDLMIMKLLAFRERDKDDLIDAASSGKVDWKKLDVIVADPTELRINLGSEEEWVEFLENYTWLLTKRPPR
jgi:hypothetical protein